MAERTGHQFSEPGHKTGWIAVTFDDRHQSALPGARGVLSIEVWSDPAAENPFRARLLLSQPAEGQPQIEYANTPEDVIRSVRQWLATVAEPSDSE
jgi:hypothetical protein